jgi:2-amino-4-hydroxy-6-hydroxymethyldihydropteridine diphosphokinase
VSITAFVGLGSNLAGQLTDPTAQLNQAVTALAQLPNTTVSAISPYYRSVAVGPAQPDYTNAVACLQTTLPPLLLLDHLQAIELAQDRVRLEHWGPRTLDLDLLLYGEQVIDLPRLQVPHPYLQQRNFVLYPLAAIAPDLVLPCGASLRSLLQHCPPTGLSCLDEPRLGQPA